MTRTVYDHVAIYVATGADPVHILIGTTSTDSYLDSASALIDTESRKNTPKGMILAGLASLPRGSEGYAETMKNFGLI